MAFLISVWLALANLVAVSQTADHHQSVADDDIRILLFCSQPNYIPGDTVYFSAYAINKKASLSGKHLIRVGLWNSANVEVAGIRLWLNEGYGLDKLVLPATMQPGLHTLSAYFEYGLPQESLVPYTTSFIVSGESLWTVPEDDREIHDTLTTRLSISGDTLKIRERIRAQFTGFSDNESAQQFHMIAIYKEDLFYPGRSSLHVLDASERVVLKDSIQQFVNLKYPAFFSGAVLNRKTGLPAPDSSRITFFLGNEDLVYPAYTGKNGRFSFPLFKPFDRQQVFYTVSVNGDIVDDYEIKLANPTLHGKLTAFTETQSPDPLHKYIMARRSIERSYQFFLNRDGVSEIQPEIFSADADIVVGLQKFDPFTSMEQLFENVVPMVRSRKSEGKFNVRIFLKEKAQYAEREPIYVIDGVMTSNTEYLMALDPAVVKQVMVIRSAQKLARFGDLGKFGVLVVETKSGEAYDKAPPKTLIVGGVSNGLTDKSAYYQPVDVPDRFPDLRPMLYWYSGTFKNDEPTVEFTTSNATGSFIIEIASVHNGKVSVSRSRFYVSK